MPQSKKVIVTGGCGYLGSVTSHYLKNQGFTPYLLDNFSTSDPHTFSDSFSESVGEICRVDLTDKEATEAVFRSIGSVHAIFHFAASALVPESVQKPWAYFNNNINATLSVAECAVQFNVPYFIHSSSCAVYGVPKTIPIVEENPYAPLSPYGESKVIAENILNQFTRWKNFQALNLRYFNPAGAIVGAGLGERHEPETHLIPKVVEHLVKQTPFEVYGEDYPTPDGSCSRDFIHVKDLAKAHLLALKYLEQHPEVKCEAINIGSGVGTSVKAICQTAEKVVGKALTISIKARRPGDPAMLVGDTTKMKALFDWEPELSIVDMIRDHFDFYRSLKT